MRLTPGTLIGAYEITDPIGAGGMGEVYRARDTKLKRDVALKVLPESFAADPARMMRFEREAELLASLNHPNIAHIYGIEDRALVMELVEGETLKRPLPVETALNYARQIAEAIEAAHEKGIVHRDLKPANIMITPAGVVKVLDFGLAKAADEFSASGDPANSPTLTISPTQAGMILGTAAYMCPEQARGKTVDRRADIWAFGAVLYEMLTGKQAFTGETVTDILASVVKEQPDLDILPNSVRAIVERCLRKDPRQRWQAIGDVRVLIEQLLENPKAALERERPIVRRPLWRRALPAAIVGVAAAAIGATTAWIFKPSVPAQVSRVSIPLTEDLRFADSVRSALAISPDGTQICYITDLRLYLRPLGELGARPIPGTENKRGIESPVFSPDGRFIAFWDQTDSALQRIAVSGGTAATIWHGAAAPIGMTWDTSGIVFAEREGIFRISPNGGHPELLVAAKNGELFAHPLILPGGQTLLFTDVVLGPRGWNNPQIVARNVKSGTQKSLIAGDEARYVSNGDLIYVARGTLFAVPFNRHRIEVTGGAVPLVEGVMQMSPFRTAQFAVSNTGSLVYISGPASSEAKYSLVYVDRNGNVEPLKLPAESYGHPRISPNGKRLAYDIDNGNDAAIWIYDLSGANAPRRLTFQGVNQCPVWTADGERVAFQSDREGDAAIFWQRADGIGPPERLTRPEPGARHIPDSFSPDGRQLSFTVVRGETAAVWTLSLRDQKATLFADSPARAEASVFSPDGRWLSYSVDGRSERVSARDAAGPAWRTEIRPFPASTARFEISAGHHPVWTRDGKQLILDVGRTRNAVVDVKTAGGFSFSSPAPFPRGFLVGAPAGPREWDILPDGRLLGVVMGDLSGGKQQTPRIEIVLNWFDELKQRVGAR